MHTITTLKEIKIWEDYDRDSTKYKFIFNTESENPLVSIVIEIEELLQPEPVYPLLPHTNQVFIEEHLVDLEGTILERREVAGYLYSFVESYIESKQRTFNKQKVRPVKKCKVRILEDGSIKLLDMHDSDISLVDILEERE